jgi:hypothetical protein
MYCSDLSSFPPSLVVFITQFQQRRYDSLTFSDANPLIRGWRTYHVINGGGAICYANIDEKIIEAAINRGLIN